MWIQLSVAMNMDCCEVSSVVRSTCRQLPTGVSACLNYACLCSMELPSTGVLPCPDLSVGEKMEQVAAERVKNFCAVVLLLSIFGMTFLWQCHCATLQG